MPAAQRRWRLDVSYLGTGFHGFAAQPDARTVAGELRGALATVLRLEDPPGITCAGRTDAGVHAVGQVVHVDLADPLFADDRGEEGARLARAVTRLLAPSIVVSRCVAVDSTFDARHTATSRSYRYLVHEAPSPSPLLAGLAWHVVGPLDVRAMAQAAYGALGVHDFRAFCRRPSGSGPGEPIVREVTGAAVEVVEDVLGTASSGRLVRIDLTAGSFCHQMVRSLTAVLVAIGRHELTAADLTERLRTGERAGLPAPAPPEGLCLMAVSYG